MNTNRRRNPLWIGGEKPCELVWMLSGILCVKRKESSVLMKDSILNLISDFPICWVNCRCVDITVHFRTIQYVVPPTAFTF